MADSHFRAEQLTGDHPRHLFSCGVVALDRYLTHQANQDLRRNLAVPYVLLDTTTGHIAGYYTLSSFSILPASLPEAETKKIGRYPQIPTVLIGRLARDLRSRGHGVGELLLLDALRRALNLSKHMGAWAVVVDAKDDNAKTFYEKFGFIRMLDDDHRLYLSMRTVEQVVSPGI